MESARRNQLKALDDLKKSREKKTRHASKRFSWKFNLTNIFLLDGERNSLLKLFRASYQGLTAAAGVGGNFCYIFLLDLPFMDESYACPWLTANSFFYLFLRWNFWDLLLFQQLNHFATIRAWKSTRLPWTIRAPTLFPHTHARRQAGRQTCVSTICLCHDKCVCVWVAQ